MASLDSKAFSLTGSGQVALEIVEVHSVKSSQTFRQLFVIAVQQDRNNPFAHRSWGAPLGSRPLALKSPRRYEDRYSSADERLPANLIPISPPGGDEPTLSSAPSQFSCEERRNTIVAV
jgi:hypothetical protein